jgi:acyl dehydratase
MDWAAPFDALTEGATFTSYGRTITESDVVQFAGLTGDHHPLHTDASFAAAGPFGERVAHGMLTISYAVGLVPLDPRRVLALRRIGDVVFKRPVKLGETIHVEGTLTGLNGISDQAGIVSFAWRIKDAKGALLTRATVDVLWSTDVPAAEAEQAAEAPAATTPPADPAAETDPAPRTPPPSAAFLDELHPAGCFVPVPL